MILAKLPPSRRREIVDSFKYTSRDSVSPTVALERFVRERVPAAVPASSSSAKRPLSSSASGKGGEPPAKRQRGEGAAIGAAPRTPPGRAPPPSRPRSPLPRSGARGGAAP